MSLGVVRILRQQGLLSAVQAAEWEGRLNRALQAENAGENVLEAEDFFGWCFRENIVSPEELAALLARLFSYPVADLDEWPSENLPDNVLHSAAARGLRCLPLLADGQRVRLAVSDPTAMADLQKALPGRVLDLVLVRHDVLMQRLDGLSRHSTEDLQAVAEELPQAAFSDGSDGPVARFVRDMLNEALKSGASDIHFECYEQRARVRFRVDGHLREVASPPLAVRAQLASRIKVMARLDIAEKRVPQDGRIHLTSDGGRPFDVRVSTLPTVYGEKVVMRILNTETEHLSVERLGLLPFQKEMLLEAVRRPHGMVLVTGPTGSGKTVSLYACLSLLNTEQVNIATAEDPVEINLSGVNQVNVNDKQGLTFAAALRAFLRQDPDIIMVGEIRDLETADIAVKAAQTGHTVFSTLHTNSAPATLSRLLNMGVAPFNIAGAVSLIMAQRLLRKLCPHCKKPSEKLPEHALLSAGFTADDLRGHWRLYRPHGCTQCKGSGYLGRTGIFELMPLNSEMQRVILEGGHEADIRAEAYRNGMLDLR
ncbi:MAG: ATPase, T2SS/T4P/T4SS family, partial [Neisseria sp.]|nr:ATPase, T2SS/T4P/T4SS family [Neisseria sp.]